MSPKPWWSAGVRFECQETGRCCVSRGTYGFVYLTIEDRRRLARHFGLSTLQFTRRHCLKTDGHFHLRDFTSACPFLEGKRCGVYEARPAQCRTWPFWPEHMSPKAWSKEVASYCPGVGKGPWFPPSGSDPCSFWIRWGRDSSSHRLIVSNDQTTLRHPNG